jgi:hypothetical protein
MHVGCGGFPGRHRTYVQIRYVVWNTSPAILLLLSDVLSDVLVFVRWVRGSFVLVRWVRGSNVVTVKQGRQQILPQSLAKK